jgi:plastocyanin
LTVTPTPGRARLRPGVLLFALAPLLLAACDAVDSRATIQLDTAEVELDGGTGLHEVTFIGVGPTDSIAPGGVRAKPGDAVRFVTGDHRTHAIGFDADRLDPEIRAYLLETNQLRGPPLVNRGAAWVVVLDGAPPGRYPFVCRTHDARGVLLVTEED